MIRIWNRFILCMALLMGLSGQLVQARTYQSETEFVKQALKVSANKSLPSPKFLWLKNEIKETVTRTLGHRYPKLRLKYWRADDKSVWILEEIGKERPITFGVVIARGKIKTIKVLAFRESRGGEIAMPVFADQFRQVGLDKDDNLDKHIDGISGATMSVNAMKKIALVALKLHHFVIDHEQLEAALR